MSGENGKIIKLLVIDSNPFLREGLKKMLEMEKDLQVVGEGERREQLFSLYEQYQPDVVLFDSNIAPPHGIEALRELTLNFPDSKVIVFTVNEEFTHVSQAIEAGASGYLLKEMEVPSIVHAIKSVSKGEVYLHPKITKDFLAEFKKLNGREKNVSFFQSDIRRPYHLLTPRESGVLQLLSEGHSNQSLGEALEISEKTVKNHVTSILRKMDLQDRTQAVVTGLKNGWIELK